jgi:sugar lactone lactonase YvrE
MSTDPDARIAAAVRAIADAPLVTPPPPGAVRARPARSRSRWAAPALAAAAVLAIAVVVALLPARGTSHRADQSADTPAGPVLPDRFAGLSPLTAAVSDSPPGTVIALYSQGALGSRRLGTSQLLVTGVDGHTYRRLDEAERSGVWGDDSEWHGAPSLLSPDGTRVAVGLGSDRIGMVDLRTGESTDIVVDPKGAAVPVSWSPDGQRLLIARSDALRSDKVSVARLEVHELATGITTPVGEAPGPPWAAPFSPDGTRVAVPVAGTDIIELVAVAGSARSRITLTSQQSLASGPSWSPDGRLLVLTEVDGASTRIAFADATGTRQPVPAPLTLRGNGVPDLLGWRDADTMLIGIDDEGGYEITEVSVQGGEPRVQSRVSHGLGNLAHVNHLQLATGLVAGADVVEAGDADRGPWPRWWRVVLGGLVLVVSLVAGLLIRRWRAVAKRGG